MPHYDILLGKCQEVLRSFPDDCIDAIVTDPPYELNFMGKAWDRSGAAFNAEIWQQCLRVLKPGGYLLAFGGSRTYHRMACAVEDAGFEIRDQIMWVYGSGFPKSRNLDGDWDGWGSALKPAHEPIVVARKPFPGTLDQNVSLYGTGALNINGCRVPHSETLRVDNGIISCRGDPPAPRGREGEASANRRYTNSGASNFSALPGPRGGNPAGRWPANLIHDGSDEVISLFPPNVGVRPHTRCGQVGDTKSAARFFYCAKTSRADRNEGCETLSMSPLYWSSGSANPGSFQSAGTDKTAQNNHPTVKPTALMRYLCRLVTPPGGWVLDPLMGSGSTGKACMLENFRFTGIDSDEEAVRIATARIRFALERQRR